MLEIRHLVKHFGQLKAVDDISFTVPRGEVLGFLGPNGAGKSTTMKMITGFLAPTSGTAIVCGHDIVTQPVSAKQRIGYLPEGAPAYPDMTPADFLDFIAHIRGYRGGEAKRRIGRVVEMIRIAEVLHQPIETLSKGYKRRIGVAQALLHDPEVLILDEPTDGLDPNQKYEMRKIITAMRSEKAIIISTHLLEEVEAVAAGRSSSPTAAFWPTGRRASLPNARAITTPCGSALPPPIRGFVPISCACREWRRLTRSATATAKR